MLSELSRVLSLHRGRRGVFESAVLGLTQG